MAKTNSWTIDYSFSSVILLDVSLVDVLLGLGLEYFGIEGASEVILFLRNLLYMPVANEV